MRGSKVELICPVCRAVLTWDYKTIHCRRNHSFDVAKEGYVNLLLSNRRTSKKPGDSKEMVKARRSFLDGGFFEPLSACLNRCVQDFLIAEHEQANSSDEISILDTGCGEGYYLGTLHNHLNLSRPNVGWSCYGIDVSRDAIRLAAKRYKGIRWIVTNLACQIPVSDCSFDVILSVFAPRNVAEFFRILQADGLLVIVAPGAHHLTELREKVMDSAQDYGHKEAEVVEKLSGSFKLRDRASLKYPMCLSYEAILNLIQMTPIYWRSTKEAKARIEELDGLDVTASFVLLFFTPFVKKNDRRLK